MSRERSKELLRRLCLAPGAPGAEDGVRQVTAEALAGVGSVSYDRMGSLICELDGPGSGPRIMLDSHLDEVGFMVQAIDAEGRLAFVPVGGWWAHVLLGQRVEIVTDRGVVPGVIGAKPPHFLSAAERDKLLAIDSMYIDIGATSRDETIAAGVQPGDPVVPQGQWIEMAVPDTFSCKAFDNRLGVAMMCEALQELAAESVARNRVTGVAAVQEEIGGRGARTAAEITRPDVAIVLECTPADDLPGFDIRQGILGGGPQIRFFDPTAVSNRRLVKLAEQVAGEIDVPVQLAVRRSGGTDAAAIQKIGSGCPTIVVGTPARYIHTHVSVMRWPDYEAGVALVVELARRLDTDTVAELTRFP